MKFEDFVNFGFDDEGVAVFDTQEETIELLSDVFDLDIDELRKSDQFNEVHDLDEWLKEHTPTDYNDEEQKDMEELVQVLKEQLVGRSYKMYEWYIESGPNLLIDFE